MERAPAIPEGYFEIAPDWVCEVLSPSTRSLDRGRKKEIYGEEGVKHLWLIDPYKRLFEAYENRNGAWVEIMALEAAGAVDAPPFQAAPFELSDLWRGRP